LLAVALMSNESEPTGRSLGALIKQLTEDISTLVRSEIALAKLEVKQAAAGIGGAAAMFATALFCGLFALAFLLVTGILALALIMPAWLATLLVAVVLLIVAGVLAMIGVKKIKTVKFVPANTIHNVSTDLRTVRMDVAKLVKRESNG
jgi:uncharacterized membrane protein